MRYALISSGLLLLCGSLSCVAQQPAITPETQQYASRLLGDTMMNGKAYEYDRELSDDIGPRLTGSANYMHAADWAEAQFRSLGLENVHKEMWAIPAAWEPESATGSITAPVAHPLHIYSSGWSPSTPSAGIEGQSS
jgi:carboxypeptidase Q